MCVKPHLLLAEIVTISKNRRTQVKKQYKDVAVYGEHCMFLTRMRMADEILRTLLQTCQKQNTPI